MMNSDSWDPTDKIKTLLAFLDEVKGMHFDGHRYTLPNDKKETLLNYSIPYDEYGDLLYLKLKSFLGTIQSVKYYEVLISEIKSKDINEDLLIIDARGGTILQYAAKKDALTTFGKENERMSNECKNIIAYYKLFNFLKSTDFCDYFNDANEEIVLYNSATGIFKIKYTTIPSIDLSIPIAEKVNSLIQTLRTIELRSFFKNALFNFSNTTGTMALHEIINKSIDLLEATKRGYELVSKNFNFEKFRDSLYKEKEKYFASLREIVSKLFGQTIAVPISISATIYSSYKVSDDRVTLIIVLLSYLLYVFYYVSIQRIYLSDIKEIKNDFENDFELIRKKSGLPANTVESETTKVKRKINNSIRIARILIGFVLGLSFLVAWFILYSISKAS